MHESTDATMRPGAPTSIRPASLADLDVLVRLEEQSFQSDRISRRSFRRFLQGDSDHLLVAEDTTGILGYILLLRRQGTRLARIYSICVDLTCRGRGIAEQLIRAGEDAVLTAGSVYVRLEVRRGNETAIRLYRRLGYRVFDAVPDYYEDGEEALRLERRIRFHTGTTSGFFVPYYNQTTPFTCGPAALLMAMGALGNATADQREELRIWREATTVYMTSGHGGCGPHGLALAAQRRGFGIEMFLNDDGVLFLDGVRDEGKKQVLGVVHEDYRAQVEEAGIPVRYKPLTVPAMALALAERKVPVVLISAWQLTREKAPHWVVVAAIDEDFVYIHDPDIKWEREETVTDRQNLPIDRTAFTRMARFGQWATRAALLVSAPSRGARRKH
jgi:ribosomal protein S18 acetylase RimI-like enzyme